MAEHQLQVIESSALPAAPGRAVTPMDMVQMALQRGDGMEIVSKLMDLQERWERNQARKAFDAAMSAAKAKIPPIIKNREVDFTSKRTNEQTNYRHEDMAGIAKVVDPILGEFGLSYRFRTVQGDGGTVSVTCIVAHRDGHFEENTLTAGRDESGQKNNLQAVGSTITYLQRYTLKAALGLSAAHDDDGRAAGRSPGEAAQDEEPRPTGKLSPAQIGQITALLADYGVPLENFLMWARQERIEDIDASVFERALQVIASYGRRVQAEKERAEKERAAEGGNN